MIKEQAEEFKNNLEKWWESDYNIETYPSETSTKILIFGLEGSYWDHYGDGKWHFYGKRNLIPANDVRHKQYTRFQNRMPKEIWGKYFTLEEAKELVDLVFGGRTAKYKEIEEIFG